MTLIPIILIALLIVGTLAFVLRPLFEPREGSGSSAGAQALTLEELLVRRDALYAALKDAELDYETGKLGGEDYQAVRARYMAEAAQVLRQIDRLAPEAEAALDADIERAVARLRSGQDQGWLAEGYPEDLVAEVETELASLIKRTAGAEKAVLACPDCGQPYQPGDAFCAACGVSLADTCPQCGALHQPDDAFCARCGAPLAESIGSL